MLRLHRPVTTVLITLLVLLAAASRRSAALPEGAAAAPSATAEPTPLARVDAATQARLEALGYSERAIDDPDPSRRGVTRNDPRAMPGVNFYCTGTAVRFVALDGTVLHEIPLEVGASSNSGCLAQLHGDTAVAVVASPLLAMARLSGQPRWVEIGPYHHDVAIDAGGLLYTLARRDGVLRRGSREVPIVGQMVVVLDPKGRVRRAVDLQAMFAPLIPDERLTMIERLAPLAGTPQQEEYMVATDVFHPNTLELVDWPHAPAGGRRVLLSLRELDLVAVVDLDERRIVWQWGDRELVGPHDPWLLPNGNVLVFDNGARPTSLPKWRGHSRVVEVDPRSGAIVRQYRGDPPQSFFSPSRGGAQPLPNGNLLITESTKGHVFEITRAGEVVWDFWNTDFDGAGVRRSLYRMHRITPERYRALRGLRPAR